MFNHTFLFLKIEKKNLDREDNAVATIVIRGATTNIMDDIERAIDDGVNCFKALTRDGRMLPGAGALEMELAQRISTYGQVRLILFNRAGFV